MLPCYRTSLKGLVPPKKLAEILSQRCSCSAHDYFDSRPFIQYIDHSFLIKNGPLSSMNYLHHILPAKVHCSTFTYQDGRQCLPLPNIQPHVDSFLLHMFTTCSFRSCRGAILFLLCRTRKCFTVV